MNVTALESQAETKITVTDGTVKKIDAAGAQVVVAESAQAGDVVAEKLENNGTVTGAVVADEIVNNGTLAEENVNAALKTAAKKALNDSFAAYSQDDYTSDNWAKLTKAKDDGLAAIDSRLDGSCNSVRQERGSRRHGGCGDNSRSDGGKPGPPRRLRSKRHLKDTRRPIMTPKHGQRSKRLTTTVLRQSRLRRMFPPSTLQNRRLLTLWLHACPRTSRL